MNALKAIVPEVRFGISEIAKIFNNGETPKKIRMSQAGSKNNSPTRIEEQPKEQRRRNKDESGAMSSDKNDSDNGRYSLRTLKEMEDRMAREAGGYASAESRMDYCTPKKRNREVSNSSNESIDKSPDHKIGRKEGEDEDKGRGGESEKGDERSTGKGTFNPKVHEIMESLNTAIMESILNKDGGQVMLAKIGVAFGRIHHLFEEVSGEDFAKHKEREERKESEYWNFDWKEEMQLEKTKRSIMAYNIDKWDLELNNNWSDIDMQIQAEIVQNVSEYRCNVEEVRIFRNARNMPTSAMIIFSSYGNKINFFRCLAYHNRNKTMVAEKYRNVSFRDSFPPEHNEDYREMVRAGMEAKKKNKITSFRVVARGPRCCPVLEGRNNKGGWHIMESRYCNKQDRRGREKQRNVDGNRRREGSSQGRKQGRRGVEDANEADIYMTKEIKMTAEVKEIIRQNPEEYAFQMQHKLDALIRQQKELEDFREECHKTQKWIEYQERRDRMDEGTFEEY